MAENNFYSGFEHHDVRDWEKIAQQELGNKDPWEKLTKAKHGVTVKPYYDRTDAVVERKTRLPRAALWQNVPKVIVTDEKNANAEALTHLNTGADGIWFDVQQDINIDLLLKKVELPFCAVYFTSKSDSFPRELADFIGSNSAKEKINGALLSNNPGSIGPFNPSENFHHAGIITKRDVNIVDEIVDSLLTAVDSIEALIIGQHYSREQAFRAVAFSLTLEADFFLSIARIRAIKNVWLTLQEAYEIKNAIPALIHVHARPWIQESFQPHGNMLYQTTAAMAAVMGGCRALTLEGEVFVDKTMTRIARNVSLMLSEESHLSKVTDPLAGSYYLDAITHQIAEAAWKKFQQA